MSELLEIFLFPKQAGNALHGVAFVFIWMTIIIVALNGLSYGTLYLTGNLSLVLGNGIGP